MAVQRACFLGLALLPCGFGRDFLARDSRITFESIRSELRGAMSDSLGTGHGIGAGRVTHIREVLTPLFRSLPTNQQGHLSSAVMRYAVQRYFRQQHGWMVKGFEPHAPVFSGSGWADDAEILQVNVPDFVRTELEEKLSHDGFSLKDGVTMIATLERLMLDEVVAGVEHAYDLNELDSKAPLGAESLSDVFTSYFIKEMLGIGTYNITVHKAKKRNIRRHYPHWDEALQFLADIFQNDLSERKHTSNPFVYADDVFCFEDIVRVAQRVTKEFGPFSNHECDLMKSALTLKDPHETGRVKMSDFYVDKAKGGEWQFGEALNYLKQSGAIDESSEALGAQVIIPNYIGGMNNCIVNKHYYSICCLNECDAVYQHLESAIPSAYASAVEILDVVEGMVIPARDGKNLSTAQRSRLEDIAGLHDGKVPLHGRLMSQWLHFAFPRDCPYPHVVGTTNPQSPRNYEAANGDGSSDVTVSEMEEFLKTESASVAPSPEAGELMWNFHEVLLETATRSDSAAAVTWRKSFRIFAVVGMLGGLTMVGLKEAGRGLAMAGLLRPEVKMAQYDV